MRYLSAVLVAAFVTFSGVRLFSYDGRLYRRTVLSADRVEAWR